MGTSSLSLECTSTNAWSLGVPVTSRVVGSEHGHSVLQDVGINGELPKRVHCPRVDGN